VEHLLGQGEAADALARWILAAESPGAGLVRLADGPRPLVLEPRRIGDQLRVAVRYCSAVTPGGSIIAIDERDVASYDELSVYGERQLASSTETTVPIILEAMPLGHRREVGAPDDSGRRAFLEYAYRVHLETNPASTGPDCLQVEELDVSGGSCRPSAAYLPAVLHADADERWLTMLERMTSSLREWLQSLTQQLSAYTPCYDRDATAPALGTYLALSGIAVQLARCEEFIALTRSRVAPAGLLASLRGVLNPILCSISSNAVADREFRRFMESLDSQGTLRTELGRRLPDLLAAPVSWQQQGRTIEELGHVIDELRAFTLELLLPLLGGGPTRTVSTSKGVV